MTRTRAVALLLLLVVTAGIVSLTYQQQAPSGESGATRNPLAGEVLVGAGDIAACSIEGKDLTAALLDKIEGTVFTLGDNAYYSGSRENFEECYDPSWGRHKERTRPAMGGHDYMTDNGAPYFEYFGDVAGPPGLGYYSYELGNWTVIVLNTICDNVEGGCGPGSPQMEWLAGELADARECTVAYMQHPWFSSGRHGPDERAQGFFEALYTAGVELVMAGNDHSYERFAAQDPDGNRDPETGLRQFVVGTGGGRLYPWDEILPNSEFRYNEDWGVLKLTLGDGSYTWQFIRTDGSTIDSGSDECHGPPV